MARLEKCLGVLAVLLLGMVTGFAGGVGAQADVDNSISLRAFNCPPSMAADALVADDCTPVTEDFDVRIASLSGIMAPLTLVDATLVGDAFVWGNDVIDARGAFGPLAIRETVLPAGFTEYVVAGTGVALGESGDWTFAVTPQDPTPVLSIYNFAPEPVAQDPVLAAAIHTGTCDRLGKATALLMSPALGAGDWAGAKDALPISTSSTTIDVSLAELLRSDHAIAVRRSDRSPGSDKATPVACGEIGGVGLPGGAVAVGLRGRSGSDLVGVAYLAPLPSDTDQTQVSLFFSSNLADRE
jgi:hypothetical protein